MRLLVASVVLAIGPAVASSRSDAEDTFMVAQVRHFDTARSLRWTFQVDGVKATHVAALRRALESAGFSEIAVPENDEENDAGIYAVWFSDVRVHTVASLAARIDTIAALLREHGGSLEYQSVEAPEAAP
ncbi:MAG TPA: hypothetical protein VFO79_00455 [Xanthomonadales bacterium]|nr:hypothetical protein [Xanthomonadales bacterium]